MIFLHISNGSEILQNRRGNVDLGRNLGLKISKYAFSALK